MNIVQTKKDIDICHITSSNNNACLFSNPVLCCPSRLGQIYIIIRILIEQIEPLWLGFIRPTIPANVSVAVRGNCSFT